MDHTELSAELDEVIQEMVNDIADEESTNSILRSMNVLSLARALRKELVGDSGL